MKKNLLGADTARTFETRDACQEWIDQRVMRFKASFVTVPVGGGMVTTQLQRHSGSIVDTAQPGFKMYAFDEPLSKIARPVRDGDVWRAVIPTTEE